jgi:hypothetical protein
MAEPRRWGKTIVGALGMALACTVLFIVPSAWIIQKGLPRWLALAVGLAAFPIAPGVWHVLAERARRRDGTKSGLTGRDRWALRLIAVAVIAIGPLVAFSRGPMWKAIKHHPGWFLRWGGPSGELGAAHIRDSALAAYVPEDALLIGWVRVTDELRDALTDDNAKRIDDDDDDDDDDAAAKDDQAKEVLVAMRGDAILFAFRTDGDVPSQSEVDKAGEAMGDKLFGKPLKLVIDHPGGDVYLVMSENWQAAIEARGKGGKPPQALFAQLDAQPTDALIVVAARAMPLPPGTVSIEEGGAAIRVVDKRLRLESTARFATPAAAVAIRAELTTAVDGIGASLPDQCKEPIATMRRGITIGGDGDRVTITADIGFEDLLGAVFCQMGGSSD